MKHKLTKLLEIAIRHANGRATQTNIPGLTIHTANTRTDVRQGLFAPMLCLVLQGTKEITIGGYTLSCNSARYFIAGLDLPASGRITRASPTRPYVSISLQLNRDLLSALISDVPFLNCADTDTTGFAVSQVTPRLLDSWSNLLGLLDFPEDIPVLTPLMEAELLYRVLKGPQNYVVRRFALTDPRHDQIRKAIDWIKAHYDQPFSASELANMAGMSTASFHRHFKAATALSPLQYQKSIRLQEARRLLVSNTNASLVAYTVGYESASQFSREYARLFGSPPARHAKRLRETDRDPGA